ncbi:MAG: SulP family inorganic anion transporter [Actinobacteria bacterium]|nr:SulP family inorganic anion transporter [Actinomycetota bacterium]
MDRTGASAQTSLARWLPILSWARRYDRRWLTTDLVAGFTIWGLLVPEMIAYAGLAGLPPQAGLYTLLASLGLYAAFGTSRQLVVAGTSAASVLLFATVSGLGPATAEDFTALAAALVLLVGVVFVLAGLLRLGFLADFLSRPVMDGFVFGLAVFVAVRQLPKLLGIEGGEGNSVEQFVHTVGHLGDVNGPTLAVAVAALALLFGLGRFAPKVPSGLVVLVAGIVGSSALGLVDHGVAIVGDIPGGLPTVAVPHVALHDLWVLVPSAAGIMLVIYSEALGAASAFADKYRYRLDPDQELVALGAANLGSGLLGGLAAGGSLSQSAVNDGAGARSEVSPLFAALLSLFTVVALTGLFEDLPEAVLGALIVHAVTHLMKVKQLRTLFRLSPSEFVLSVLTLTAVLVFDVLPALILGVVVSILLVVGRASRPTVSRLGRDGSGSWVDVDRHPGATEVPGVLVVRPNAPLFYANAQAVRDAVVAMALAGGGGEEGDAVGEGGVAAVVLDLQASDDLDLTSGEHLVKLAEALDRAGVDLCLSEVHAPARAAAEAIGLAEGVGDDRFFPDVHRAVAWAESRGPA